VACTRVACDPNVTFLFTPATSRAIGTPFDTEEPNPYQQEVYMGSEDRLAGKIKQAKGKANDIAGAVKGDTAQQLKGKVQKAVGKVQEKLGKKNTER
jgi:uncharacterized protein YjbJ (UPF0337 family)